MYIGILPLRFVGVFFLLCQQGSLERDRGTAHPDWSFSLASNIERGLRQKCSPRTILQNPKVCSLPSISFFSYLRLYIFSACSTTSCRAHFERLESKVNLSFKLRRKKFCDSTCCGLVGYRMESARHSIPSRIARSLKYGEKVSNAPFKARQKAERGHDLKKTDTRFRYRSLVAASLV